jgi:hypothetical protein
MVMHKHRKEKGSLIEEERLDWHVAFFEAIQAELSEYRQVLDFTYQRQLSAEPLRIDVVIIKKAGSATLKKNIAAIFREVNIIEYKSPEDYISERDFYKAYGYACLYASLEKIPIDNLTLTFAGSRHPKKLIGHLEKKRRFAVAEKSPGVYIVSGDILPIQIIDSRKLSADENIWLRDLDNRLDAHEYRRITNEAARHGGASELGAYLNVITRANKEILEEVLSMSGTTLTLEQIFEKTGVLARFETKYRSEGEENGKTEIARNMVSMGLPFETIVSATQLDPEKIKLLYENRV